MPREDRKNPRSLLQNLGPMLDEEDGRLLVGPQDGPFEPNLSTPIKQGLSTFECWYSGVANQTAYSTGTPTINRLYAQPFVIGQAGVLDRIAFEVTTGGGGGSVGRCGLYNATSRMNIYPSTLIVDGGEFDCTSIATKVTTISLAVTPGLYWCVLLFGVAAPVIRRLALGSIPGLFGVPNTIGTAGWAALFGAQAYGALPSIFPAGFSLTNGSAVSGGDVGVVHVRFSG